ncbi:MAG: hypothetical protein H5T69_19560, partial [Chloroflexi bacterium]|nr:hypothetical protein [Chloroflexota bacterium]
PWSAIVIDTQRSGASFSLINVTVDDLLGQNYLLHAQYDDPQVSIDLTLRNSIFSARGPRSSLWLAGAVHLNADHNLFYAPQSNVVLIHGDREYTAEELAVLGDGHLYGAPRFVAPAWGSEGDYHLRQDSPALDAGTSQGAPTIDLEGRPRGASPDLGAYEMGLPTFRRAFEPGWHLVSIPTLTLDPRIDRVLASLAGAYDWVETYDAAEGRRRYYDPLDPAASTLDRLEPGTAFWIHLTSSATLQISGSLTSTSQSLVGGWNLIGYPDLEARPVEEVLAPILESCRTVFGYDAGQRWRWYDVRAPRWATTLHYLEPGCGYWLWVQEACVLDISPESSK